MTEDLQKGNKKLDFRTQEFENDSHHVILSNNCGGEKQTSSLGEGSCVNELNVDILRPSAEVLSANLTTNAQNDKIKSPLPPLLVCSRLTGLRARLSALTLRPQLASPFNKGGKKVAFTLAEVLVTLGVIGIVAAMTLPMLAENYQRIIVQTRLKKFYTTFNQAILRSVEINGPSDSWFYLVSDKNDSNGNKIHQVDTIASNFDYYLRPYLNVIQTQKIIYTNGTENWLYYLADGSAFTYVQHENRDLTYYPKDPVRCLRQPAVNRDGVCSFTFSFYPSLPTYAGSIKAWKYHLNKGLEAHMYNWNGSRESLYEDSVRGCAISDSNGAYCTAIIQQNGWEFPKDYPRKIRY